MKAHSRALLTSIANGAWCISHQSAYAYLPTVVKLLKGESTFDTPERDPRQLVKLIVPPTVKYPKGQVVEMPGTGSVDKAVKEKGTVVIIPIIDAITKYDMACGPVGMLTRAAQIREAAGNDKVKGIICLFDTPGGEAAATTIMEQAILQARENKPVYGIVQGMMCSAGIWIGSACTELYISSETDIVGSIGTMISLVSYAKYFEKEGIQLHDIYATSSTDKNREFHQALEGNYKPIQKNLLDPLNEVFTTTVTKNRPNLNKATTLSGRTFIGSSAIKQGLVDGKTDLETLILNTMLGVNRLRKFKGKTFTTGLQKDLQALLEKEGVKGFKLVHDEALSVLLNTTEGVGIYVYAEEGDDLTGKQCVWADENGEPTEDPVDEGDHELSDGSVATVTIHDDGLSYIDAITEPMNNEEEGDGEPDGDAPEGNAKKPVVKGGKKPAPKKPVKQATKTKVKTGGLSSEGKAILKAIEGKFSELREDLDAEFEDIRSNISSEGEVPGDVNTISHTAPKGQSVREKTGKTAMQRRIEELRAKRNGK